jgi:hypothetical protein
LRVLAFGCGRARVTQAGCVEGRVALVEIERRRSRGASVLVELGPEPLADFRWAGSFD